ncbi:hypothetical protein Hanom_Chr09g00766041 [Helianthus anomalus]
MDLLLNFFFKYVYGLHCRLQVLKFLSLLSGTFVDSPTPETEWEEMAPAPVPRLDGASIQINCRS